MKMPETSRLSLAPLRALGACALLALIVIITATAQESRGTIRGRVTDTAGSALPGVKVEAVNAATGVTAAATTNEEGVFNLPFLVPGDYRITATGQGFKRFIQPSVPVRVSETIEVNAALEPGEVSESVEVQAEAVQLDTISPSQGLVVDEKRIQELPLFAGNPVGELSMLTPGVTNTTDMRARKAPFNNAPSQFTSDGNAQYSNEFAIDGIPNNFAVGNGTSRIAFSPPVYAVKEFKIQTAAFDAAIGHTIGSVANVNTRSGTNEIHGEAHYWAQNTAFNSRSFDNNRFNTTPAVLQDHRYGASAGGPVVLPWLYNGKNKTFWYYAYEGNRFGTPFQYTTTVPTARMRGGDLSELLTLGANYQIYNPFTTVPAANGRFTRQPFAGNLIPTNLLNPVALNLLKLYPLPTAPGIVNNWSVATKSQDRYDVHFVRLDHAFSDKHRAFARVHYDTWEERRTPVSTFLSPDTNLLVFNRDNAGLALDDVYTLTPTLVLNARYGLTYQKFPERRISQGTDLAALGFASALVSLVDQSLATVPSVTINGFARLSPWEDGDGANASLTHTFFVGATKLIDKHSLKFGADARLYRAFGNRYPQDISPAFTFSNAYTRGPLDNSPVAPLGQELAAFLLGIPGGQLQRTASFATQEKYFALYAHDDFKLTPRLTVNIGLRYEIETPFTERYDRLAANFDFNQPAAFEAAARAAYAASPVAELPVSELRAPGALTFANQNSSRSPFLNTRHALLPRLGIVWQFVDKTVVRAGFGTYYDSLGVNRVAPNQTGYTQATPIIPTLDNGQTYIATLQNPFPNGLQQPVGAAFVTPSTFNQAITFYDPNLKQPYASRWSLGVQRELPLGFLLDAEYVGNRGTRLRVFRNYNVTPARFLSTQPYRDQDTINFLSQQVRNPFFGLVPGATQQISRGQLLQPYPHLGTVGREEPIGYAWYHSLQTSVNKRFARGFTVQLAYTWSKVMEATEFLNATDPLPYEVIGAFDRPHRIAGSAIWELPFGKGRHLANNLPGWADLLIGGWQVSGFMQKQSGAPLGFGNVNYFGDLKNIPLPDDERDTGVGTVPTWFNTTGVTALVRDARGNCTPPPNAVGFNRDPNCQLGSNIRTFPTRFSFIRSDNQTRWDLSLSKTFALTERVKFQFRLDAFNAFNHVNFNPPDTGVTNPNFGRILSAAVSNPRQLQLIGKLTF